MSREPEDLLPFEEELSAYLDGELDAEREAQVRAELARRPALTARLAELREVDARLRALPAAAAPDDLRARLQERIDAQERRASGWTARAPTRRSRWLSAPRIAAAAVAAAAVALMILVGRPVSDRSTERVVAEPVPEVPTRIVEQPVPEVPTRVVAEAPPVDLSAANDEELEIAMDWEMLEDLEVIEELELLEEMVAQADRGRG